MHGIAKWPLALLLAIGLVGCSGDQHVGGKQRPVVYNRIISLSPSTTEILMQYNANINWVIGRTASDNFPSYAEHIPIVASVKPDYEKIQSLNPNLIVYDAGLYSQSDIQQIDAMGVKTFAINADTVKTFESQLFELGKLIGAETKLSNYAYKIDSMVAIAQGDPITPTPKVAVILPGQGSEDLIDGTQSFLADAIRLAGGQLVGPPGDKFVPLNPETIVEQNPDIILIPSTESRAASDVSEIYADPRLQTVTAIKKKHLSALDEDVMLRRGSRVDLLIDNLHRALKMKG